MARENSVVFVFKISVRRQRVCFASKTVHEKNYIHEFKFKQYMCVLKKLCDFQRYYQVLRKRGRGSLYPSRFSHRAIDLFIFFLMVWVYGSGPIGFGLKSRAKPW